MIIIEDAPNQLPPELEGVEDYIVATFHVHFDDIIDTANGYVQNCICDHSGMSDPRVSTVWESLANLFRNERPADFNCFGEPCELVNAQDFGRDRNMTLWKRWDTTKCLNGELNVTCVRENCNYLTTEVTSCAEQAEFFFRNPDGYDSPGSMILAVNGQLEPTLNITADTWVRLRLGYMASKFIL